MLRRIGRTVAVLAIAVPALLLSGCGFRGADGPDDGTAAAPEVVTDTQAWVVVMFEDRPDRFDADLMDALLDTELAADEALAAASAGYIDGNDVGDHGYELYFAGGDVELMWSVLEPVFADAPVPWTRVELWNGRDDASPRVLTQE